jgi:hypothetical protein
MSAATIPATIIVSPFRPGIRPSIASLGRLLLLRPARS